MGAIETSLLSSSSTPLAEEDQQQLLVELQRQLLPTAVSLVLQNSIDLELQGADRQNLEVKYSPDQPRDERGRWTDGGGAVESSWMNSTSNDAPLRLNVPKKEKALAAIKEWASNPAVFHIDGPFFARFYGEKDVVGFEIKPDVNGGIRLSLIRVDEASRGKGLASRALQELIDIADKHQQVITGTVSPEKGGLTKRQLFSWYKRYGFERTRGDDIRREPKSQADKKQARPLTPVEQKIDLKAIADTFDQGEADLLAQLQKLRQKILDDALEGIIELEPADYHTLTVDPPVEGRAAFLEELRRIYNEGRDLVLGELEAQGADDLGDIGPLTEEDEAYLEDIGNITLSKVTNDTQSRVIGLATGLALAGLAGMALYDRLRSDMAEASTSYLNPAAAGASHAVLNEGRSTEAEANAGLIENVYYSAILDEATCDICEGADGQTGDTEEDIPPAPNPECAGRERCVTPDTIVGGQVVGASKAWYEGKMVEIRTVGGQNLTITPNHPVLTPKGFVPAGNLRELDEIVSDASWLKQNSPAIYEYYQPLRIDEVFKSLSGIKGTRAHTHKDSERSTTDFHGDGASIKGDVNVVVHEGFLLRHSPASDSNFISELVLVTPTISDMNLTALSLSDPFVQRNVSPACGLPSIPEQLLSGFETVSPPLLHALGAISQVDTCLQKSAGEDVSVDQSFVRELFDRFSSDIPIDEVKKQTFRNRECFIEGNSRSVEFFVHRGSANPSFYSKSLDANLSSLVTVDKVLEIRDFDFSGHVYDLQTVGGWYSAAGIIVGNCRCIHIFVYAGEAKANKDLITVGDLTVAPAAQTGAGTLIGTRIAKRKKRRQRYQELLAQASEQAKQTEPEEEPEDQGAGTPHPVTGRRYSSTQVNLPFELAERVKQLGCELIPDDELDPEEGREEKPHCTVKYGIHAESPDDVIEALKGLGPVKATIGDLMIFETNPDYDVVNLSVKSNGLRKLNRIIAQSTQVTDTQPSYIPHICLAYVRKGEGEKYIGFHTDLTGQSVEFDRVLFSSRDGTETEILLTGPSEKINPNVNEQPRDNHGRWTSANAPVAEMGLLDIENPLVTFTTPTGQELSIPSINWAKVSETYESVSHFIHKIHPLLESAEIWENVVHNVLHSLSSPAGQQAMSLLPFLKSNDDFRQLAGQLDKAIKSKDAKTAVILAEKLLLVAYQCQAGLKDEQHRSLVNDFVTGMENLVTSLGDDASKVKAAWEKAQTGLKYSPDQPRDDHGRWTDAGGSPSQSSSEAERSTRSPARVVESPAFKRWFGNSKVVDKNGRPQIVFHGSTRNDISEFRTDSSKDWEMFDRALGAHFAEDPGVTATFSIGQYARPSDFNVSDYEGESWYRDASGALRYDGIPVLISGPEGQETVVPYDPKIHGYQWGIGDRYERGRLGVVPQGGTTYPVYLSIQHPLVIEPAERELDQAAIAKRVGELVYPKDRQLFIDAMSSTGRSQIAGEMWDTLSSGKPYNWGGVETFKDFADVARNFTPALNSVAGRAKKVLQELGYDGIRYRNTSRNEIRASGNSWTWIAFKPTQVKSALGNTTFDPANPNITKSLKYREDQARDDRGRWVEEGGGGLANNETPAEALEWANNGAEAENILAHTDAKKVSFNDYGSDKVVYVLGDNIVEVDSVGATVTPFDRWIYDQDPAQFYPDTENQFNEEFWSGGGAVYHATTEDHVASILENGLSPRDETRGLSNRWVGSSVFTTSNYEEALAGYYGDQIFEIDVGEMARDAKRDGIELPRASREPDAVEYDLRSALAHRLGFRNWEPEMEGGISPETIIIDGPIPAKYLKLITAKFLKFADLKVNPNVDEQPRDDHGRWTDAGGGEPWQATREEYAPHPYGKNPEASDEELRAYHRRRQDWDQSMNAAISLGKITPEEAKAKGFYTQDNWQPLPPVMYHVTTAADSVEKSGLKTRYELSQHLGAGLGGGDDMTVSFTTSPETAEAIAYAMREAHDVASGKKTMMDMLNEARDGVGAPKPFYSDVMYYYDKRWQAGDPLPLQLDAQLRGKYLSTGNLGSPPRDRSGTLAGDWTPSPRDEGWQGADKRYYSMWERSMTPDEVRDHNFSLYKIFAAFRESAGGRLDPLFFMSDLKALAEMDPKQISIMEFKPASPEARGYRMGALGEWRTGTGRAVEFTKRIP